MVFTPPLPRNEPDLHWAGIDFDNTLVRNTGYPEFIPTTPIEENLAKLHETRQDGWDVVIWTSRHWSDHEMIRRWCKYHGVKAKHIIPGKPLFGLVVDDKALNASEPHWRLL